MLCADGSVPFGHARVGHCQALKYATPLSGNRQGCCFLLPLCFHPFMSEQQSTADVLMIRPASFCANPQTIESNCFQSHPTPTDQTHDEAQSLAILEFDRLVVALQVAGVRVHVFDDSVEPQTPDAIFPNNWVSFHADGTVVLFPMFAPNRRLERRKDVIASLRNTCGFHAARLIDLTHHEQAGHFLEGTGSLVLDRVNRIAYACLSARTHPDVLAEYGRQLDYDIINFDAHDSHGFPIYHTNVLMSIGTQFATVCADAIERGQRSRVLDALKTTGHQVIELSHEQMHNFAGNMLELATTDNRRIVALSDRAAAALTQEQRDALRTYSGPLVSAAIPTIENLGGGSVRCMLAEIHLARAN